VVVCVCWRRLPRSFVGGGVAWLWLNVDVDGGGGSEGGGSRMKGKRKERQKSRLGEVEEGRIEMR